LFVGTVLPYQIVGQNTFTLVTFQSASNLWGGVVGWWIPIVLMMLVAASVLISVTRVEWRFIAGGMLLAFAVPLLTGFVANALYASSNPLAPSPLAPGGAIGTVGGVVATIGGFLAILL
jgi:hypothetical protein